MFHPQVIEKPILSLIPSDVDNLIILDVAQGSGCWGFLIKTIKNGTPILIGLDIWPPYIEKLNSFNIYDSLIICDVRKTPIRSRLAHIVIACELLEHIPRKELKDFIEEMEKLYRNRIIISTPSGFMRSTNIDENPYQKHVSGWTMNDLKKLGFNVVVFNNKPIARTIILFMKLRAFILRRKLSQTLIAWKSRGLRDG